MSRFRMVLLAAAIALFATACAGGGTEVASTTSAVQDQAEAVAPATQEAPAPAAQEVAEEPTAVPAPPSPLMGTFATIGDGQIDLGSLQGQDVVLWFWAPW